MCSPLAALRCSPDTQGFQEGPGGNAAGVQPAVFLLHSFLQLAVWQRLNRQQGSVMRIALQDKAIVLCNCQTPVIIAWVGKHLVCAEQVQEGPGL